LSKVLRSNPKVYNLDQKDASTLSDDHTNSSGLLSSHRNDWKDTKAVMVCR